MEGITFLGKHSYKDFGFTLAPGKSIGNPEKEKMKVKPAFSNVEYDFSRIYGSQPYSTRSLKYPFNVFSTGVKSKQKMNSKRTQLINWLSNSNGKQKLYDDAFPGYYFLAEVEDGVDFDEDYESGVITATFTAYPFMIADNPEGDAIWDTFNFELDVMQNIEYIIEGTRTITLINAGTPNVFPDIESTGNMTIDLNGRSYTVDTGMTKNARLPLNNGENHLTITGNGTIKFTFNKELI
ncbi:MAG: phage tail family protein [Tetragenococcus koreensis]|nr:phage tail family protein [Tetragenococcus koreensis]